MGGKTWVSSQFSLDQTRPVTSQNPHPSHVYPYGPYGGFTNRLLQNPPFFVSHTCHTHLPTNSIHRSRYIRKPWDIMGCPDPWVPPPIRIHDATTLFSTSCCDAVAVLQLFNSGLGLLERRCRGWDGMSLQENQLTTTSKQIEKVWEGEIDHYFRKTVLFCNFFLRLAIKFHWSWGFPTICWGYLVDVPRQLDEEGQRNLQSCDADHPAVIPLGHAGNIKWISLYISGDIMCIYIYMYTHFSLSQALKVYSLLPLAGGAN